MLKLSARTLTLAVAIMAAVLLAVCVANLAAPLDRASISDAIGRGAQSSGQQFASADVGASAGALPRSIHGAQCILRRGCSVGPTALAPPRSGDRVASSFGLFASPLRI